MEMDLKVAIEGSLWCAQVSDVFLEHVEHNEI